jgi:hypothetical protein
LKVDSAKNASVSINVPSQICKFHEMNFTDRRNYCQYPQRLTGLDSLKKEYVIV